MVEPQRVARDARGLRTTYEEIDIGADLGSVEWRFTREQIAAICESDDDFHEWYWVDSPYGGVIAPVLLSYPAVRLMFSRAFNVRGVFYALEMDSLAPLHPETTYRLSARVCDKWVRRNREFVQYEAVCTDPDGQVVFRTKRTHAIDFLPTSVPKTATGIDSGAGGAADLEGEGQA